MKTTEKHNLQVLRGLTTNRCLLSCDKDGGGVNLWNEDDGSGRQQWEFKQIQGNIYNIIIRKGITCNQGYLSCTKDGGKVDLYPEDDGSGRQRWEVIPVTNSPTCNTYLIKVDEGVSSNRRYLSCTEGGDKVDLWDKDDGSGRQRFQIQGIWEA